MIAYDNFYKNSLVINGCDKLFTLHKTITYAGIEDHVKNN